MMHWRALVLAVLGLSAIPALAQNLVLNPSFETGTIASWTATGTCPFDVLPPPPATTGAGNWPAQAPTNGAFLLMSDAAAPGTCTLFQDIALPGGFQYNLSAALGYNYRNFGGPAGTGCSATVAVTTTGGAPLATFYSHSGGGLQAVSARPALLLPAGVAGTTVRLIITTVSCIEGPAGIVADNFVLAAAGPLPNPVPTVSEWAMILLALLMMAAALQALRRR